MWLLRNHTNNQRFVCSSLESIQVFLMANKMANKHEPWVLEFVPLLSVEAPLPDKEAEVTLNKLKLQKYQGLQPLGRSGDTE